MKQVVLGCEKCCIFELARATRVGCLALGRLTMELTSKCEEFALSEDRVDVVILDQVRFLLRPCQSQSPGHHQLLCVRVHARIREHRVDVGLRFVNHAQSEDSFGVELPLDKRICAYVNLKMPTCVVLGIFGKSGCVRAGVMSSFVAVAPYLAMSNSVIHTSVCVFAPPLAAPL